MSQPQIWPIGTADVKTLEKYHSGYVKDVVEMAQREQRHQHTTDRIGQILAAFLALCFLAASTLLIFNGFEVAGTILGTVDLVALVTVFITSGRPPRELRVSGDSSGSGEPGGSGVST